MNGEGAREPGKRMDGLGQRREERRAKMQGEGGKVEEEALDGTGLKRYSGLRAKMVEEKGSWGETRERRDISPGKVVGAFRRISTCIGIKEGAGAIVSRRVRR